jgi:hypothetical protein
MKKACNFTIYRLLMCIDIDIRGDKGSGLEHLSDILRIIREVYQEK